MDFDENKEPNKKTSRKGKNPKRHEPRANTVKTLEREKSKEKKIALETDSDVGQIKNNTSREKPLVIKEEPVLGSPSCSVKTLETEKSKGKRIALETYSDVGQRKKSSSGEKPLVIKEPVLGNTSPSVKTLETESKSKGKRICLESDSDVWEKKKNTCGEKHESMKNPSFCGYRLANCVKVLRQMEFAEYIDKDFRQSFLSWYSLRAEPEEMIVARTFIHAFKDDLEALAEQLIHSFTKSISDSKKRSTNGDGDGASSSGACFKKPRHN